MIGGHGYLGRHIKKKLNKKFIILGSKNKKKLNILNINTLNNYIDKNLYCIINLAGQINNNVKKINYTGNANIIKIIKKKKIQPLLIFFSTTLVKNYKKKKIKKKNLLQKYIEAKLNTEKLIKKDYSNFIIIRISNVYDEKFEKKGIFKNIIKSITKNEILKINNIYSHRNYINIKDVIFHLLNILIKPKKKLIGKTITLANENFNIKSIINLFEKKFKKKINMINLKTKLNKDYSQKIYDDTSKYTGLKNKFNLRKTLKNYR